MLLLCREGTLNGIGPGHLCQGKTAGRVASARLTRSAGTTGARPADLGGPLHLVCRNGRRRGIPSCDAVNQGLVSGNILAVFEDIVEPECADVLLE